jgi:hypothetical protein
VRFAAAVVEFVRVRLGAAGTPPDQGVVAEQAERLGFLRDVLIDVVGGEGFGRYADGRPVVSLVPVDAATSWVRVWHPSPGHVLNRAGECGSMVTGCGQRKRVVCPAPGHLDTITEQQEF